MDNQTVPPVQRRADDGQTPEIALRKRDDLNDISFFDNLKHAEGYLVLDEQNPADYEVFYLEPLNVPQTEEIDAWAVFVQKSLDNLD